MLGYKSSAEQGRATGLDGLDLGRGEGDPAEALGQLVAVEVDALGGLDGAQVRRGLRADAADGADGLAQGAVLLRVVPVRGERGVRAAVAAAAEAGW